MQIFRADLHTHTVLSPCGSLDMSPAAIVAEANYKNLDIIGITDHNHTGHCNLVAELAEEKGIFVLRGAEVTTKEEVHCLAFFEDDETLMDFQELLDASITKVNNNPDLFGYQVITDKDEQIVEQIDHLLINATKLSVEKLAEEVHNRRGIFIPAHVNRSAFSLTSQLGFIDPAIPADALEISRHITVEEFRKKNPFLSKFTVIQSSDAHFIPDIGNVHTKFELQEASFEEIRMALKNEKGRRVIN